MSMEGNCRLDASKVKLGGLNVHGCKYACDKMEIQVIAATTMEGKTGRPKCAQMEIWL